MAFIVFVSFKLIGSNQDAGTGLSQGVIAPKFAAPSGRGTLTGYANVFQTHASAVSSGRKQAACEVTDKDAIRVCDYFNRPLVMVFWSTKCGDCGHAVTKVQKLRARYPDVNFLAVATVDSVKDVKSRIDKEGWTIPVAVDQDGRVGALYNVAIPPATFFIFKGEKAKQGQNAKVMHSAIDQLSDTALADDIERLIRASRKQGRS
ncbi:MAG: TlpA disulfide reductase family protein [Dehalococcoidia bacterium]